MIEINDLRNALLQAQKIADQQDPVALGGIFRYPLNATLGLRASVFAMNDTVKDMPVFYAEFRFLKLGWVFAGVKGL